MGKIIIKNMQFNAFHGVYEHERRNGNTFIVSIKINTSTEKAAESDKLEDTIDYAKVYALCAHEMQIPSKLLEHIASRIQKKICMHFNITHNNVHVCITKKNAPIEGFTGDVKVCI